ncbi:MAG: hypothetical protein GX456_17860 [Verrucomicrobia bacterium]|nr:hypothetical protein [Verrucomicrobiota bacterium]
MEAANGINSGKPHLRKRGFRLFRPIAVKPDGRRVQSPNWSVRFQHQGKRTCRSLHTADYRLALQRAKQLVSSVRQHGWEGNSIVPAQHAAMTIEELLDRFQKAAVARGLRPKSIKWIVSSLRRIARDCGVQRVCDLTPARIQQWVSECKLKPVSLNSALRTASVVFSRQSLQSMGLVGVKNPFKEVVRPKVDREGFVAPPREWISELMQQGIRELEGDERLGFVLALGCGLRWGEIVSLSWENVLPEGVRVLASLAKGRRSRIVPVGDPVRGVLESSRGTGPVIESNPKLVHQELCSWLRGKGVKDSKPIHYLRKCYGSLAVADHGIFIASKLLGHADIGLTARTYAGQVDKLPAVRF